MGLTQYYTATTLDGFIADESHSLDWLFTRDQRPDGLLNYRSFIADVGALAMGSTTYEWILDHEFADKDPADWKWPYDIPCWVFTHRQLTAVPDARSIHRAPSHRVAPKAPPPHCAPQRLEPAAETGRSVRRHGVQPAALSRLDEAASSHIARSRSPRACPSSLLHACSSAAEAPERGAAIRTATSHAARPVPAALATVARDGCRGPSRLPSWPTRPRTGPSGGR